MWLRGPFRLALKLLSLGAAIATAVAVVSYAAGSRSGIVAASSSQTVATASLGAR